MLRLSLSLPLFFGGCGLFGDPVALDDSADADADADADTDADSDADSDSDVDVDVNAPVVEITSVTCTVNVDSEPTWIVNGTATDPQGEDDITVMDNFAVIVQNDRPGTERPAVFANGALLASWTSTEDEESCTLTGTVQLYAMDDDGHLSEGAEYAWPAE